MTIDFTAEYDLNLDIDYQQIADKVINGALDYEKFPYECYVSLTLVDNASIHSINREFRETDRATDVLSFPMVDYDTSGEYDFLEDREDCFDPESGELVLGDIVVSLDKVKEQAEAYGHSYLREYAFLIAHSMLHLMGYDHMEAEEAVIMEKKQAEILAGLGINR